MPDPSDWDDFVKEGNILFKYMINNFKDMFDYENNITIIKHFDIGFGPYDAMTYTHYIKEKYIEDIQSELIPWIIKEVGSNELFNYNNWRPFRDQDLLLYMFLGYKKMFKYKQYYFQLSLLRDCDYCSKCKYCISSNTSIHFALALYGWKEVDSIELQPDNIVTIPDDNILPNSFWNNNLR